MTELRDRVQASLGETYRLDRELGGGGMSRVFVAHDTRLGRQVVVKVLSPDLAAGVNSERFHREILVAAQLQHPHIVPVLAAGETDGLPYFTMPYVAGESLRRRLEGGKPLPVVDAVAVLRDVARALAYAHEHGVVHRDIKPDNVLIAGGAAAVTDFGIAKALSSSRTFQGDESLTRVGNSLGTPAYMAPEQVAADPNADHRIDIYSFGAMAYELLSGVPPFHGRPPHAVLSAHLTEMPPPLESRAPDAPPALVTLVMKCLAKNPADRPQAAEEVVRALERIDLSGDWRAPATVVPDARRPRMLVAAAAIVVAIAAGGWLLWDRLRDRAPAPDRNMVAVVPFRVASADPALHYLREGMLDLLAAKLTGEGGLRATDPRQLLDAWRQAGGSESAELPRAEALALARQVGAGQLLLGDVVGTPNQIVLTASLLGSQRGDSLARLSVEGPPDSLAWLVDRLAARLLAETSTEGSARAPSLTSTSLPALRAYLDGQAKIRRADVVGAAKDFERALQADSTFALAALGLRMASSWYGDGTLGQRGLEIAWRERARLPQRDQILLEAVAGPRYPEPPTAYELLQARERYVGYAPDRADAWYLLGDHVFHYGWVLDVPNPEERALDSFRRASEIDSSYVVGYLHALPLALTLGDTVAARRFERLRMAADTSTYWVGMHRWHEAWVRGDTAKARAVADSIDLSRYVFGMSQLAFYAGDGTPDVRRALDTALEKAPALQRRGFERMAHDFELVAGRPAAALAHLIASADSADDVNVPVLEVRDALIADGDTSAALEGVRFLSKFDAGPVSSDSVRRTVQRAATRVLEPWRLSRGDTSQTRRSIARLRELTRNLAGARKVDAEVEIAAIEAMHADVTRSPALRAATTRLDSLLRIMDYPSTNVGRASFANLVAARLFEKLGDTRRALAAARRRSDAWAQNNPYLATQLREQGRLAALAGEREEAIRAYRHYLALRADAEPALRPQVEAVRRGLAELEKASVGR
ncbi:MAG: putative serine/threonine protein kinase [Geminicoccaceae bacterium]|jgi:serine/threonine-protein kinase|nr:putative serine/threonine protein kinase [Geminicoccaceae bacterium]